jgi:hypothetical protein
VVAGVSYEALRRCRRTPEDCAQRFGNIINYRGFPKVPGIEHMARIIRANV